MAIGPGNLDTLPLRYSTSTTQATVFEKHRSAMLLDVQHKVTDRRSHPLQYPLQAFFRPELEAIFQSLVMIHHFGDIVRTNWGGEFPFSPHLALSTG